MLKTTAPFMSPEFLENKTRITRPSDLHLITTFSLRALRTCDFVFIDGVSGKKMQIFNLWRREVRKSAGGKLITVNVTIFTNEAFHVLYLKMQYKDVDAESGES